jgi:ABC-type uncharacterized transport system substrate-binding protein
VIGLLVNPTNPRSELVVQQIEEAARALGLKLHVLKVSTVPDRLLALADEVIE